MAIIALLLAIAAPRYMHSVDKAREAVLHENLASIRQALDRFYGDTGKYPDTLEMLVEKRYLRSLPLDPVTDSVTTWVVVPPDAPEKGVVFDVKSGAPGVARDGTEYGKW